MIDYQGCALPAELANHPVRYFCNAGAKVGLFFIYAIADASFFILLGMFFSFGPLTTRASLQETGLLP